MSSLPREGGFSEGEIGCVVEALHRTRAYYGNLCDLPEGALCQVGGLRRDSALEVEGVIRELIASEQRSPTVARVVAELDAQDRISYRVDR